ncbi:MAG TPA: outer membrane beta-barrel protein [Longimicrobiales bacterium]|nr:outer membrane beta-barrel protein [Longimicrobiales bacterium]
MRRIPLIALLAALSISFAPTSVDAQFLFRGVEFWGGQYAWSGDDVETLEAGFRGGFGLYAELTPGFGVGLEGVTGGFDSPGVGRANRTRWDDAEANLVVRQALGDRAGVHPFVGGRFGWTRISTTAPSSTEGEVIVVQEDGLSYGAEIGVEIPLNRRARVVAAAGATFRDYGDAELNGVGLENTAFSGTRWGLRVGIAIGRAVD